MSKKQRNTPNNYSGNFFLETGTRKHEKDINPFGKVKMNNGKKDINFNVLLRVFYFLLPSCLTYLYICNLFYSILCLIKSSFYPGK